MIPLQNTRMSQILLVTSCLVALGGGSGLIGSPSDVRTTTASPNTPGPPSYPTLSSPEGLGHPHNQTPSFSNVTVTLLPLTTTPTSTTHTTGMTNPSLPTSSASSVVTVPSEDGPSGTTPSDFSTSTRGTPEHTNVGEEQPQPATLGSSREWFIRRKHKGPYFERRVKKLTDTLRSPEFKVVSKQRRFNISETTPDLRDFPGLRVATSGMRVTFNKSDTKKNSRDFSQFRNTRNNTKRNSKRKRPIAMGIPASSTVLLTPTPSPTPPPSTAEPRDGPVESDEYYSSYGEYPDVPLARYNNSGYAEAAVLPDPEVEVEEEEPEPEVEVALPDDSLADTDLHDHDLIDSVMYIYFGSSERDERGAGRQVLIVGAVISLVAQFLTLVSVLRRLHSHPSESASLILLNAELALTAGNLVFMLGVQATGSKRRCELVAFTLHYLHLVTSCWFLVNSVFSYLGLHKPETRRRLRPWWLAAWSVPALVVVASVMFNRRGYETRAFCWMSVARGMLYSFMVPVAILILLNTCLTVLGLRQLSLSDKADDTDRKSMRVSATLLPVFAVVWFLGVVALENSISLVFPLLFVASSGFLNWFVLACWLPADLSLWRETDDDYEDDDDDIYEEVLKTPADSQPLLEDGPLDHMYACGRRDPCDLQMDPICTISGYSTQLNTI